jgi:hypothetical protein
MGRGRAKAKQTRKARELKYSSPDLNADALQRELTGGSGVSTHDPDPDDYPSPTEFAYRVDDDDEDDYRRR